MGFDDEKFTNYFILNCGKFKQVHDLVKNERSIRTKKHIRTTKTTAGNCERETGVRGVTTSRHCATSLYAPTCADPHSSVVHRNSRESPCSTPYHFAACRIDGNRRPRMLRRCQPDGNVGEAEEVPITLSNKRTERRRNRIK